MSARFHYVCSCQGHVSANDTWTGARAINCPRGGQWVLRHVETLSDAQEAAEEASIFGRVR